METRSKRNVLISSPSGLRGGARVEHAMMEDDVAAETSNANRRGREEDMGEVPEDGGMEEQAGDVPAQSSKVYVAASCAPLRFARTIASFNEAKRDAVRSLGLGGLLEIKPHSLDVQLIKNLVDRFDTANSTLKVHGCVISANVFEVGRILGLPTQGTSVEEFCDSDEEILLELRIRYNLGQGEEFMARFLLYAITAILSPSTSLYLKPKYVGLLENLDMCPTLNWSKFTFEGLLAGIELFKRKRLSNDEHQLMGGCLMILKLMYLERVMVRGGQRGSLLNRERPRMKD